MISCISELRRSRAAVLAVVSLAIFTDMFSFGVIVPILPRILSRVGEVSDARQSVLYVCYAIGLFVTTPIIGWISDAYKTRQAPMLIGLIGLACSTLLFAHAPSFRMLLLARVFQGISAASTWVVGFAILADTYPCEDGLGTAVGIAMGCSSAGYLAGPCLGGILNELFGPLSPFYFCFGLTVLDLIGRLLIRSNGIQHNKGGGGHSYAAILKNWKFLLVLLAVIFSASIFSAVETFISEHLAKTFHLSDFWISQLFMTIIFPNILSSLIVGKACDMGFSRIRIISLGLFLHALAAPFTAFSPTLTLFVISAAFFGGTHSLISAVAMPELAAIAQNFGSDAYASVYAAFNMAYSVGMAVGPLIVGAIKPRTSFGVALSVISFFMMLYAPVFLLLNRGK